MFSKNLTTVTGNITPYMAAAIFYLIVTLPLIKVVGIVEKNLARSERGGGPRPKAQAAGRASEQEGDDEGLEVAGSSHAEASDVDELPGALRALVAPFCAHNTFGGMADAE